MGDLQLPTGKIPGERPQACLDFTSIQVPQRPLADLLQERGKGVPVDLSRAIVPARQPVLQPVVGRLPNGVGPGRVQPGVQLLLLELEGVDDILLRPPAGFVPPAPAVRLEPLLISPRQRPGQRRWYLLSVHLAPSWSKKMLPLPWAPFPMRGILPVAPAMVPG